MEYSNLSKKRGKDTSAFEGIIENADYLMDLDGSYKKRIRVDVEDSRWDENYLSFLVDLEDYLEAKFVKEDDDDEEDVDDEEDPTYAMFLENLKEHGKGYMLDVSVEHGVYSPIMYEIETGPSVVNRRKAPRTRQDTCIRNKSRLDVDSQFKSRAEDSTRACQGTSTRKEGGIDQKTKLKSGLKKCGSAKEAEPAFVDLIKRETSRTHHGYNMRRRGLEGERQLKPDLRNSDFVCKVEKDPLDVIEKEGCSGMKNELKSGLKNSRVVENGVDPSQAIKKKTSITRQDGNIQKKGVQEKRAQVADETYNEFFSGLKIVGDSMLYEFGECQQVFYEGSGQHNSTDAENEEAPRQPTQSPALPTNCSPTSISTPSVKVENTIPVPLSRTANHKMQNTSVTDNGHGKNGKDSRKGHSKLWKELSGILGKPFDQDEFDYLWKEMTDRKEVQIYRDSRSGGTYKPGGHMGDSYLDTYPELNDEIKKVMSDSRKVLKLLRMLSFYLMKVPHGIPRPWLANYRHMFLP